MGNRLTAQADLKELYVEGYFINFLFFINTKKRMRSFFLIDRFGLRKVIGGTKGGGQGHNNVHGGLPQKSYFILFYLFIFFTCVQQLSLITYYSTTRA